jgi:hypothetical protein
VWASVLEKLMRTLSTITPIRFSHRALAGIAPQRIATHDKIVVITLSGKYFHSNKNKKPLFTTFYSKDYP